MRGFHRPTLKKKWQHSTMKKEQKFTQDEENTAATLAPKPPKIQPMFETTKHPRRANIEKKSLLDNCYVDERRLGLPAP